MRRLRIAYNWSNDIYSPQYSSSPARFLADALDVHLGDVEFIGGRISFEKSILMRLYYHYLYLIRANYMADTWKFLAKLRSTALSKRLKTGDYDILFSRNTIGLSYLKTDLPVFVYHDAVFDSCVDYYESHTNKKRHSIDLGNKQERMALKKAKCVILSSKWAVNDARKRYNINVNYETSLIGANIRNIEKYITNSDMSKHNSNFCTIVFVSSKGSWRRKGGDIAYRVAKLLNQKGLNTKLLIIGDYPRELRFDEQYVKCVPYLDKNKERDCQQYCNLLQQANYHILPTRIDFTPNTIAEANAFGTPVIASAISGIPEMIDDGISGLLLSPNADPEEYATRILNHYRNKEEYLKTVEGAKRMFESKLNWDSSAKRISKIVWKYINQK